MRQFVGKHYCYNGKHLFCNMFHVIAFSKRHASEAPPIMWKWRLDSTFLSLIIPLDIASINTLFYKQPALNSLIHT